MGKICEITTEQTNRKLSSEKGKGKRLKAWYKNWQLYLLAFPALLIIALFCYAPMYGISCAFGCRGD